MKKGNVIKMTMTALMAAVLCILAPLAIGIPFSTVPISGATFAVYLCAGLLGTKLGVLSVLIYILLGFIGIPVFAGWSSGPGVVFGPAGGYVIGYLVIAAFVGIFVEKYGNKLRTMVLGMALGTIGCYTIGTIWMGLQLQLDIKAALLAGVIPFIPGDIVKIVMASAILIPVRKQVSLFQRPETIEK